MSCYQTIVDRVTVHNYAAGAVDKALVERALGAATAAPNHRLTEPWRFVCVGPASRQRLMEIARELREAALGAKLPEAAVAKLREKMLNPAELIVVGRLRDPSPDVEREDYAAVACAIHGLMLVLSEAGVGSKWTTGEVTRDERTYRLLEIDRDSQEIVGFVWVGVAQGSTPKPRRRKALEQVVRFVP